ncbi:MAG: hypothetical protein KDA89_12320 [Planctomycetaceae bacterium]|nr:hypothetical protein [Planctomycetaceae bacterium]
MTKSHSRSSVIQQRLIDCLRREEQQYNNATQLMEKLAAVTSKTGTQPQQDIVTLQQHLKAIRTTGEAVAAAVDQHRTEGLPPSAELQDALKKQQQRLELFLTRIDDIRHVFSGLSDQLRPQLDQDANRRAMRAAYSKAMRTGN